MVVMLVLCYCLGSFDTWSLESCRLFEIDNRTQFQKDMRSIMNDYSSNNSSVRSLLANN